jgi:hypothetical protein
MSDRAFIRRLLNQKTPTTGKSVTSFETHYNAQQRQDMLTELRSIGKDVVAAMRRSTGLIEFGDNPATLAAMDKFADLYFSQREKTEQSTNSILFGLGTLLSDLLARKYGGTWPMGPTYSLQVKDAEGDLTKLYPFAPTKARINGDKLYSMSRYYYEEAPRLLGFSAGGADDNPTLAAIRNHSRIVLNMFSKIEKSQGFGFNAASIGRLDLYIESHINPKSSDLDKQRLMNLFGSFLGEAIAMRYGGEWMFGEKGPYMQLRAKQIHFLNPHGKVAKRIVNGKQDSLQVFFSEMIPAVLKA